MTLFDTITEHLQDPNVVAVIMEGELEPTGGPNQAFAPPTYARPKGDDSSNPAFAVTADARVPERADSGWFHAFQRTDDGPRTASRVVINSVQACAHSAGTNTYLQRSRLGVELPAFVIRGTNEGAADKVIKAHAASSPIIAEQIRQALDVEVSHWELAHRTADSWLQYADDGGGQIWAQQSSAIKDILLNISHESGQLVYENAPNCAVYGSWLSSGTARRHAIPRAYSCEITGYGAEEVRRGATKLDEVGGALKASGLEVSDGGTLQRAKRGEPSALGFGQVPTHVADRAFTCELILRQATISLKALDRFSFPRPEQTLAAKRVFVLLAMAGHLLAAEDGFLRSSCDLVTLEERWGWRRHGQRAPEALDVPSVDDVAAALRQAITAAEEAGLTFAKPFEVRLSDVEADLIASSVANQSARAAQE